MSAPISITLYDKNDQPIKTYQRDKIPWGFLKRAQLLAIELQVTELEAAVGMPRSNAETATGFIPRLKAFIKRLFGQKAATSTSPEERQFDLLSQFVVDLFDNQFSRQDLENCAELGEVVTVYRSVIARADQVVKSNPTIRPHRKKR